MKKIISAGLILAVLGGIFVSFPKNSIGQKDVFYQTGELFELYGKNWLLVPNNHDIELFKITQDDKITKINEFKGSGQPTKALVTPGKNNETHAIVLSGDRIVEYNISNLNSVKFLRQIGPNWDHYDYYYDIALYQNNQFLTAGKNGISLWDANNVNYLKNIYDKPTYGLAPFKKAIYAVSEEGAVLFNAVLDKFVDKYMQVSEQRHQPFADDIGRGYFPGDDVIKLRTFSKYKNLEHTSGSGNAVDGFENSDFVYFTNGWGVYKLDKALNVIRKYNTSEKEGNWAAGVKVMKLEQGERIIVFNGNSILLFNEHLNLLDEYSYTSVYAKTIQDGFMGLSHSHAATGTAVTIYGRGFFPGEEVDFKFGSIKETLTANNIGLIQKIVKVPDVVSGTISMVMKGMLSGYSHGFNFTVD